jgi:hypothetical protein
MAVQVFAGLIRQVTRWFNNFHESRKGRLRREIAALKEKKDRIMKSPPSKGKVKKIEKIMRAIKEKEAYLISE